MSINAPEIDRILAELDPIDHHIQKVIQPDFRNLYLYLFRPPHAWWMRICLENPRVRFHRTNHPPRAKRSKQRFEDFLWSRVRGGRITDVEHLHRDRIVRFVVERSGRTTWLYLRLWGSKANLIATDTNGTILDAFFRKPNQGIETGATFAPEPPESPGKPREIRPIEPGRTLNEQIEAEYRRAELDRERERLIAGCTKALEKQLRRTRARLTEVGRGADERGSPDRSRHYGDLILANAHRIASGDRWVELEDYADENRPITIELDPAKSAAENANAYYERARRAEESSAYLESSREALEHRRARIESQLASLPEMEIGELRALADRLTQTRDTGPGDKALPGLEFESHGFRILVGRNARENDELLRHATRGNDWWLHTRDHAGGYVFIRNRPGKSVPLEVLLDAGNLAIFFSKARAEGRADLYYTQVKYLRRAKDAPKGLVIPTQERNLTVDVDEHRLARLGVGAGLPAR